MDWHEVIRHILPLTLRTLTLWLTVLVVMRWTGKRTVTAMAPFDLALVIMVSEVASIPIADLEVDLFHGVLPVFLLGALHVGLTTLNLRSRKAEEYTEGRPALLIAHGRIIMRNLVEERVSLADLAASLRQQQVTELADVEEAWLEPTGGLSVIFRPEARPLTLKDLERHEEGRASLTHIHADMQRMLARRSERGPEQAPGQALVPGMEVYTSQAFGPERKQGGERGNTS